MKNNLEDLIEKITWTMDHDEQAQVIGEHGRKFAQDNLMPLDVICYHSTVLQVGNPYNQVEHSWASRIVWMTFFYFRSGPKGLDILSKLDQIWS